MDGSVGCTMLVSFQSEFNSYFHHISPQDHQVLVVSVSVKIIT